MQDKVYRVSCGGQEMYMGYDETTALTIRKAVVHKEGHEPKLEIASFEDVPDYTGNFLHVISSDNSATAKRWLRTQDLGLLPPHVVVWTGLGVTKARQWKEGDRCVWLGELEDSLGDQIIEVLMSTGMPESAIEIPELRASG